MIKRISIIIGIILLLMCGNTFISGECKFNGQTDCYIIDIDDFIISEMEKKHIPGLSASIVIDDNVVFSGAYGFADIENNVKVTNDTLFKIASVSKTITATALMQLYEDGLFDLHDSINNFLPFEVFHPDFPSDEITFHMLLTHSSSIVDNWDYLFYFVGDAPIYFQDFLEKYLTIGGEYYDSEKNFGSWEPGTRFSYSNIAVALIGYLIEVITNTDFTDYCQINLFDKLEMYESAWYLRDLNISHIALPYHWNGSGYNTYGHIGYVDVPAGDLRTSSHQLSHFLNMFINNGIFNSESIISEDIVDLMLTPQTLVNSNIGLIWWKDIIGGRIVWGHGGSDFGCRAMMQFDPLTKIGLVVLINGESGISNIVDVLFNYAENILDNLPPNTPTITGPTSGKAGDSYKYTIVTTDPEDDEISYFVDWGDGNTGGWTRLLPSGREYNVSYIWQEQGIYTIKVKAKDEYGAESYWATLEVSMPKTKSISVFNSWILRLIQRFPILELLI
jgi:CubicO group peptidase (beta-lactamase class C family)